MATVKNLNVVENPNPKSSDKILLDTTGTVLEESYPNGVYAILTYSADGATGSASLSSATVLGNTAYQDEPFSDQISSVSLTAQQIVSEQKKGWMTISIDTDSTDVVYIGPAGVTSGSGYYLKSSNPTITVSSDDLSEWYAVGDSGGETLYIIGAYLNE